MSISLIAASASRAHEVLPSIADMERLGDELVFNIEMNLESFIAGIDQSATTDTNNTPQAIEYDELRALSDDALSTEFQVFWPEMAKGISIVIDGVSASPVLRTVIVEPTPNFDLPRQSNVTFSVPVPSGASTVDVGWASEYGALVLRQNGVADPFESYLEPGATTGPFDLGGGYTPSGLQTFLNYIPVGFDHIVPLGLDHILFVLGLFFLSTRMGPLLWQVSAFTLAHTITLALAALGYVTVPGHIVEPLIALSIVYVAVENLYTDGLSRWRPFIIFGFGLLHGLGFATVLAEFGLPDSSFIPALIGFNIGVEIGQLAVIAVAYLIVYRAIENARNGDKEPAVSIGYLVAMVITIMLLIPLSNFDFYTDMVPVIATAAILMGLCAVSANVPRFEGYREIVAMPASILIAVVAAYWCVERVFL